MANEMIKFLRGNVASLPATATPGSVYFTKDEGLYLGLEDGSYHRYGDFITVNDVASLPADGAHETCMYYCVAENVLAKWNGTSWTQINKQKTLAELGGVAKSVYEAKVAALEKADTDNATAISNLTTYVGTIPNDENGDPMAASVIAYINKKTDGIATSGNLEALGNRVGTAEGEIDALQAAIGENGSVTNAIAEAKAAGDNAQSDVNTLAGKVGTVEEGKTVVGLISDAQTQANKGVADAATAQARADEAYNLANGKATMDEVNTAIANAGHAVKSDVDKAIEDMDAAYKKADGDMKSELEGKINAKVAQSDYDAKVAELAGADTTLQGNIDALAGKVGTPTEGKTIVQMISDAQTAATYDDTKVKEDIKANADAIAEIEKDYLTSVEEKALQDQITANANAITLLTNGVSADEVDGVNDLIQYVKDHGSEVTGMKEDIAENAKAISDHETLAANTYETKEDAGKKLTEAKAYTDTEVAKDRARLDALELIDHDHSNKGVLDGITAEKVSAWDASEKNAKDYVDGKITDLKIGDYAKQADLQAHIDDEVAHITAAEREAWNKAEQNAKDYADGLADNYADADHDHVVADITDFETVVEARITAKGYATTGYADGKADAAKEAAIADAAGKYETKGTAQGIVDGLKLSETYEPIGAENRAVAAAKTETETQVKALADGQVTTNKNDIASLFEQFTWGSF